jgi:hypothetical protein
MWGLPFEVVNPELIEGDEEYGIKASADWARIQLKDDSLHRDLTLHLSPHMLQQITNFVLVEMQR